ncbi:MAG: hypothetical protein ACRCWR_01665 [Saezia sp.]
MATRKTGARTLQQILDQAPSLAQLQQQINFSKACLAAITPLIPILMRKVVRAGPIEQQTMPDGSTHQCWVILADHTAAATKLRQLQPLFLQYLEKANLGIQEVKVQIMPHTTPL